MDRQSEMSLFFRIVDVESCSAADRTIKPRLSTVFKLVSSLEDPLGANP